MIYAIMLLIGLVGGGVSVFIALTERQRKLREQKARQDAKESELRASIQSAEAKKRALETEKAEFEVRRRGFEARVVSYDELLGENAILKRDLQNVDVNLRKLQLDGERRRGIQEELDRRGKELGRQYLGENVKWIGKSITASNFGASKKRLLDVVDRCRAIGLEIPTDEEQGLLAAVKEEFEKAVRAALEREEQARIKAQIREEQKLEREIERELKQLEREREAIKAALEKALAEAKDEHSEEIERLRARLAEAEEKSQRAISRAQMTKSGHVYVISNIGSFGEGVFKIGMTRRLEPNDRVRELSSASVPFPYDVHMMISSDDAPSLEGAMHRALHRSRVNKTNPRKEFFKADIDAIGQIVVEHHGEVQYIADAEALEYRQSLEMTDEDLEFIESVYDSSEEDEEDVVEEP